MDEFFNTLTLIQTRSITQFPVVLFGTAYYGPLMRVIEQMEKEGTISASDLSLVLLTDSIDDAMKHINSYLAQNYDIRKKRKRFWWLFE
jgi:predicted Rossmann-fold nucleotide-binding protein